MRMFKYLNFTMHRLTFLIFLIIFLFTDSWADQCVVISKDQASIALKYLKEGITIYEFCPPCGDNFPKPVIIRNVQILKWQNSPTDVQISVNHEDIDLAYVYVPDGRGNYINLAMLTNCPVSDVPRYLPQRKEVIEDLAEPAPSPIPIPARSQQLISESFIIEAGNYKSYGWHFPTGGTLEIAIYADLDIYLYIVDELNFWKFKAGEGFYTLLKKERITRGKYSVGIPKEGEYIIIISNHHSILTPKNVSLEVNYSPYSY